MGVDVNFFKSTKYESGKGLVEFLKRVYSPMGELTPIPLNSLLKIRSNTFVLLQVQEMLQEQGLSTDLLDQVGSLISITEKREILMGAPLIQIKGEIPQNVSAGYSQE